MLCCLALLALFACIQGRAVNISNTWVLPEEGFPVFYRYFRDRISWYEADAVCQFHHANLVTVDTTAQYDAVRAYLKELDISTAVWVGLIRSNPEGEFSWTDFHGLSGEGYWSSAPDSTLTPLCAAADPAADYRWQARPCGGPSVASFICELPVPQWALGPKGCMVQELPALTVLYLPESAAVQLTADCGLAEAKKVTCTGNVKREELLQQLSCMQEEDTTLLPNISSIDAEGSTSETNILELNVTNYDVTSSSTEENITTLKGLTEKPNSLTSSEVEIENAIITHDTYKKQPFKSSLSKIYVEKNINLDILHNNNLQSNDIPKLADDEMLLKNEQIQKMEDEKHIQQKMLHDELAHGNFDKIYSQQTDHFVPPLVMAKARVSDDMTVLSLAEKHAQQLADHRNKMLSLKDHKYSDIKVSLSLKQAEKTNEKQENKLKDKFLLTTSKTKQSFKEIKSKKEKIKYSLPKKYNGKYEDMHSKTSKTISDLPVADKLFKNVDVSTTTTIPISNLLVQNETEDDSTIDITVVLKEPDEKLNITSQNAVAETIAATPIMSTVAGDLSTKILQTLPSVGPENITFTHDVVKITLVQNLEDKNSTEKVLEIATKIPLFDSMTTAQNDNSFDASRTSINTKNSEVVFKMNSVSTDISSTKYPNESKETITSPSSTLKSMEVNVSLTSVATPTKIETTDLTPTFISKATVIASVENVTHKTDEVLTESSVHPTHSSESPILEDNNFNITVAESIDDLNSPLLSGADEPLHRPNRLRRPQPQNHMKKFNPFRILG